MTRKLLAITFAAIFAACNSNPKTSTETTTSLSGDTAGFRNNSMADQGQVIELKGVSDTIVTGSGDRYVKVDPNQPAQTVKTSTTPRRSTARRTTKSSGRSSSGGYSGSGNSGGGGYGTQTASTPERKKGWSKAAKGAVIGAGAGAVGGAIISKKKGLGAVVGGVVGGAGGYIIGRNKDKKDGRY